MAQKKSVKASTKSTPLWWQPILDWQKNINHTWQSFSGFLPSALLDQEENLFGNIQKNLNRAYCCMFNGWQGMMPWMLGYVHEPAVNIIESKEEFKIRMPLADIDPKNVKVISQGDAVTVKGVYSQEETKKGDNYVHHEQISRTFNRTIALPDHADTDRANMSIKDQILTLIIPKKSGKEQKVPANKNQKNSIREAS